MQHFNSVKSINYIDSGEVSTVKTWKKKKTTALKTWKTICRDVCGGVGVGTSGTVDTTIPDEDNLN